MRLTVFLTLLAPVFSDKNGGMNCAACTLVSSLLYQYADKIDGTGSEAFSAFCDLQPTMVRTACNVLSGLVNRRFDLDKITELGGTISADEACQSLGYCKNEGDGYCRLYQKPYTEQFSKIGIQKILGITPSETGSFYNDFCLGEAKEFCDMAS